ncbi:hypothetical protein [Desulfovermiculus halophilus]|uniref:hypothetical protein n=1 Tax=Desulfovermiculus halophilus TaxID=339722 RepID=UPI0004804B89|nr:hypothetical protein [Desulfovermiculus halophilus]
MFTVSHLSRISCRWSASAFAVRFSNTSITGYVACVGFRSFALARRLAVYAAPQLPPVCKGVRMRKGGGMWWVSVPVAKESVPEEVARGGAVCSMGPPPDVRQALVGSGRA